MWTSNGYHADMQGVSGEIDANFGEPVRLTPVTKKPNFDPRPDESNAVDLVAVFSWRSSVAFRNEPGLIAKAGLIETRSPIFTFSRDALPWAIQQGDIITRCCSGEQFQVKSVEPDGVSRITCPSVQLGRASQ